jgi:hypothetical protein
MQERKLMEVDDDLWKKVKLYCVDKEIKISEFVDAALKAELTKRGVR